MIGSMDIVAAPDKFKGTATAAEVAAAIARAAAEVGMSTREVPLADGGDGTLEALGGPNRSSAVTGPLGETVEAEWRYHAGVAVIEMARSSGLVLAGGPEGNDPLNATTAGVGELMVNALDAGAKTIIVGVGGSATTDGGRGAVDVLGSTARLRGVDVVVACDVRTSFVDAAPVFAPQKGASVAQVALLRSRLETLVEQYRTEFGVDVGSLDRAGAAGGLAGGLAALGARLVDGFDLVADRLNLDDAIAGSKLVITGEGFIDDESFEGKVIGGVLDRASSLGVPVLAVAGQVLDGTEERIDAISLADEFGVEKAIAETTECIYQAVLNRLQSL